MNIEQFASRSDDPVRSYEYHDATVIAADLGPGAEAVDVVGDTAIVTYEDSRQLDLDLPDGDDVTAFIRNGVLSIRVME